MGSRASSFVGQRAKIIFVDFDNTLVFTNKIIQRTARELLKRKVISLEEIRNLPRPQKSAVYNTAFAKYLKLGRVNKALLKRLAQEKGAKVVVLTANTTKNARLAAKLLKKNGFRFNSMLMRNRNTLKTHDEVWKSRKIGEMAGRYKQIEVYEDKKDNIEYLIGNVSHPDVRYFLVEGPEIKRVYS